MVRSCLFLFYYYRARHQNAGPARTLKERVDEFLCQNKSYAGSLVLTLDQPLVMICPELTQAFLSDNLHCASGWQNGRNTTSSLASFSFNTNESGNSPMVDASVMFDPQIVLLQHPCFFFLVSSPCLHLVKNPSFQFNLPVDYITSINLVG